MPDDRLGDQAGLGGPQLRKAMIVALLNVAMSGLCEHSASLRWNARS